MRTKFDLRQGVQLAKKAPRRGGGAVSPGRSEAESWVRVGKGSESRRDGTTPQTSVFLSGHGFHPCHKATRQLPIFAESQ